MPRNRQKKILLFEQKVRLILVYFNLNKTKKINKDSKYSYFIIKGGSDTNIYVNKQNMKIRGIPSFHLFRHFAISCLRISEYHSVCQLC